MQSKALSSQGFDIYEVTKNEWILDTKTKEIYAGTFAQVVSYAVLKFGFDINEIEFAVKYMIENDHNGAHFGIRGGFIFTFKKDFELEKVAS